MANPIDLTTLTDVKTWLGLLSNPADDLLLARLITSASSLIEEVLERDIVVTTYTNETYNGIGATSLTLRQYPIQSVASISIDGTSYTSGFTFDDRTIYLTSLAFTKGRANIKVTYTAGFAVVPFGIQQSCVELVGLIYRDKDRIGHMSKQLAGEVVTFNTADFTSRIKTSLHQWMNVVPV